MSKELIQETGQNWLVRWLRTAPLLVLLVIEFFASGKDAHSFWTLCFSVFLTLFWMDPLLKIESQRWREFWLTAYLLLAFVMTILLWTWLSTHNGDWIAAALVTVNYLIFPIIDIYSSSLQKRTNQASTL